MKRFIKQSDRKRHVYISGKTQYGKSTLIQAMAYQDMRNGDGLCVIDAKGTLIPQLLDWVPEHRKNDCIYLDLKTPIPIDFMDAESEKERGTLVSDIVQIFNRMEDGLGSRMGSILRWTVSSLHLCGGGTFMDIYKVLTDAQLRKKIREHPAIRQREEYRNFWDVQAEKMMKGESGVAIAITRMTQFVLSEPLNIILGTKGASLNIAQAIQQQKVILVRLQSNSDEDMLYGSLIASKIQQAIFRREPGEKHTPFMLYVDEFQNFKTSGFEKILSEGGGLGLYLTFANQYFAQLRDSKLEDAIIGCVSSYFLFNMNPENAGRISSELHEPKPKEYTGPSVRDLNEALKFWKPRQDLSTNDGGREAYFNVIEIEEAIERAKRPPKKPITFLSRLPNLRPGQAVYKSAFGTTCLIKVPFPPPLEKVGKTSHAHWIKQNTIDKYAKPAQNGNNRTVDSAPLHSLQERHDVSNGPRITNIEKPEVEPSEAPSSIPPHKN